MNFRLIISRTILVNILVLLFTITCIPLHGQSNSKTVTFRGKVLEKGSQTPLEGGATIALPQYSLWAITEKDGTFSIRNTPVGQADLVISILGYISIEQKYTIPEDDLIPVFFWSRTLFG